MKEIVLAGGCFWGLQHYYDVAHGVLASEAGYANGKTCEPNYLEVCSGQTGFAEAVLIRYDETEVSLNGILRLFFDAIDPFQKNGQGNDVGTQYRSGIYFMDADDEAVIRSFVKNVEKELKQKVATEVLPLKNYYSAEEYHQKYLEKHPYGYCHIGKEAMSHARNFREDV